MIRIQIRVEMTHSKIDTFCIGEILLLLLIRKNVLLTNLSQNYVNEVFTTLVSIGLCQFQVAFNESVSRFSLFFLPPARYLK